MTNAGPDPAFVEAAYNAKKQHNELLIIELPLMHAREEPPSVDIKQTGVFLFKLMSFGEFDTFSKLIRLGDIADLVIKNCLVYPADPWENNEIQRVEPGFFEEAATVLVEASGFEHKDGMFEMLGVGRMMSNSIYGAAQMFICKAFPGFTPRDISLMSMPEMFRYLAMSEQLLAANGSPTEFPLREFFKPPRRRPEQNHIPKDFSKLPVYTAEQLESMRAANAMEASVQAIREKRAADLDPETKASKAVEIRRKKIQSIAESRRQD